MAITNATRVADFGSGIGTEGAVLKVDNTNKRIGIGTNNPNQMLQVGTAVSVYGNSGIVSATSFYGDGTNLSGLASTDFINATQLNVIGVATASSFVGNVTGNASGTAGGLTGTPDITVRNITGVAATFTGVLTYEDVTNVDSVGIVTARGGLEVGAAGVGATITSTGNAIISGFSTFKNDVTFVGAGANITFDQSTDDLIFDDGAKAIFGSSSDASLYHVSGNTYLANSTGNLILGSGGSDTTIKISPVNGEEGIVVTPNTSVDLYYNNSKKFETTSSGAITTGIHTVTVGTNLDGYKVEEGSYDTNALNGEFDFELENGHVQTHTGSTAGTYFPDFRVSSSQSLSSVMGVGDVVSATLIVAASNTAHYCTTGIKIDNSTSNVTIEWIGSSAPSAGKGAGYDIYSFTIQKTAATPAYLVIVNATDAG